MANERTHKSVDSLYRSSGRTPWRELRAQLFQSDLAAPTDVNPDDIMFERRATIYRLMLIMMLVSVGSIGFQHVLFSPLTSPTTWLALVGFAALSATLLRLHTRQQILIPPIFALLFNIALVLWCVATGDSHQSLWLFPLMIGLAGLIPSGVALAAGSLTVLVLMAIQWAVGSFANVGEIAALLATWALSLAVMRLLTHHADELADLALSDPLTGAYNRRYLQPQAIRNIADYQRYSRLSSMLMIDIDHFKTINDTLGHAQGDRVLKDLVALIENRIRGVDMVFRLGGEEFVVLLTEVGAQTAIKIAEELRLGIANMTTLPGRRVTVSIGVCDVTSVDSAEEWLERVDQAMYTAKQEGRNRVHAVMSVNPVDVHISSSLPVWR